ncbi:MAG: C4-dicarboxylate ABC transporter substrate-binding protein, partial [Pseudomonadota bacterium]
MRQKWIETSLIGAAVMAATFTTGAAMAQTELSLGHFMPPRHTMHGGVFEPWAEQVAEITDGEVTVRIFPAGELGAGPVQQYSRAVDGIADITFGLQGYTSSEFPRTLLAELPGLFDDAFDA